MTQQEEAKEWLPLIEAMAEGKTIQWHKEDTDEWIDYRLHELDLCGDNPSEYRIKPATTYRPFKDCEELVAEYCKRFGVECKAWEMPQIWMRYTVTNSNIIHLIYGMGIDGVKIDNATASLKYLFESYAFLDGSPCGVEEANKC